MTYDQTVKYLFNLQFFGIKMGLDNIAKLCRFFGTPQNSYESVHIAGTNGKGTVCALTESVLRQAGYNTGLYTSPHLIDFRERIKVNGAVVEKDFVVDFTKRAKPLISELKATFFEVTTAMAFTWFAQKKIDIAVIETGMGGRLDATNILDPVLTLITSVDMDHEKYLGDKLENIAYEKAGILKPYTHAVFSEMKPTALSVLKKKAMDISCPVTYAEKSVPVKDIHYSDRETSFTAFTNCSEHRLNIPFAGKHQIKNASSALAAINQLRSLGYNIHDNNITEGFSKVKWPARFQILNTHPRIVFDVSHNPAGAHSVIDSFTSCFPDKTPLFIIGMMQDKNISAFLKILIKAGGRIILTSLKTKRAATANELEKSAHILHPVKKDSVCSAVEHARTIAKDNEIIVITGSFYTVGEAMKHLKLS